MGQTLTHGIYLPDEGERNCYNGLAGNWQLLDGAVGTVAEHTNQIAGKASASHTHGNITNDGKVGTTANLPLITGTGGVVQAGAFGNQANTFCEGNDSRLSDARTPVAHTHGKADITDLFNSENTWRGSNSFNSGLTINNAASLNAVLQNAVKGDVSTTGDFAIFIKDKVNGNAATSLLAVYRGGQDSGGSYAQINIDTKGNDNNRYNNSILLRINPADNSNNAILIPQRDKTIDLGSSSYQWNNLYAKNYYYNGTAWGLDQANEWTGDNTFSSATNSVFCFKFGTSGSYSDIRWKDNNGSHYATLRGRVNELTLGLQYSSASAWYSGASVNINNNGSVQIKAYDGNEPWTVNFTPIGVYPTSDKVLELGTSTNKWKTLNGINPGALSLPDLSVSQNVDTNGWVYNGTTLNSVLLNSGDTNVTKNGWLYIRTNNTVAGDRVAVRLKNVTAEDPTTIAGEIGFGHIEIFVPLVAGYQAYVFTNKAPTYIKFYPCLGNVPSGV